MNKTQDIKEIAKQLRQLLEQRSKKACKIAKRIVLDETIESKEVREALDYFMNKCWHDTTRPALLSLTCEAVGGDPDFTIPIAIPILLISGAIDIHDDILDQSEIKGSHPTVFGKFGRNVALIAGDALLYKGFTLLNKSTQKGVPVEKIAVISEVIKKAFFELGDAVAMELKFRDRINVSSEEYLRVVRKKAADVEADARIGSILGNGTKKEIEALSAYARLLGMMLVLNADLSDMLDHEELFNRINKEHIPSPVIYALEHSKDRSEINLILQKKKKTRKDINKIIEFTNKAEGSVFVAEKMKTISNDAIKHLNHIKINKENLKMLIKELIPLVIDCPG